MVIDLSPDDHRRVAFTVVAVSALPRPPLAALSLAPVPLQPRRRRGEQLRRPSPRFHPSVAVASSPSSTKLAQLAAPRHAALSRDLLEHVRTPVNA